MKKTVLILAVAALAGGCRDNSSSLQRDQQNYGVVQEGATGAATSTLNAPGEAPPPMTATNVDTTSNLTLLPGTATAPGQPGTIAGTMTGNQNGSMNVGYANDGSIATPRARVARPAAPRVVTNETHPEPATADTAAGAVPPMTSAAPARPANQPSTASPAPAPSTDTASAAPSDTSDQKPKDKPKESKPPEPAPSTDTSTTTAPPPTRT